ncbi:MAG: S-layer homology domain-containing protein, partial [Oscillospiraceae bacterium]|nr:S-layer homology domain-containing protein [Oscillospiraceae bacterium]
MYDFDVDSIIADAIADYALSLVFDLKDMQDRNAKLEIGPEDLRALLEDVILEFYWEKSITMKMAFESEFSAAMSLNPGALLAPVELFVNALPDLSDFSLLPDIKGQLADTKAALNALAPDPFYITYDVYAPVDIKFQLATLDAWVNLGDGTNDFTVENLLDFVDIFVGEVTIDFDFTGLSKMLAAYDTAVGMINNLLSAIDNMMSIATSILPSFLLNVMPTPPTLALPTSVEVKTQVTDAINNVVQTTFGENELTQTIKDALTPQILKDILAVISGAFDVVHDTIHSAIAGIYNLMINHLPTITIELADIYDPIQALLKNLEGEHKIISVEDNEFSFGYDYTSLKNGTYTELSLDAVKTSYWLGDLNKAFGVNGYIGDVLPTLPSISLPEIPDFIGILRGYINENIVDPIMKLFETKTIKDKIEGALNTHFGEMIDDLLDDITAAISTDITDALQAAAYVVKDIFNISVPFLPDDISLLAGLITIDINATLPFIYPRNFLDIFDIKLLPEINTGITELMGNIATYVPTKLLGWAKTIADNVGVQLQLVSEFNPTAIKRVVLKGVSASPAQYTLSSASAVTVDVAGTQTITNTISPVPESAVTYTYASSNTAVATVSSNGTITGVGYGSCVITVTATFTCTDTDGSTIVKTVTTQVPVTVEEGGGSVLYALTVTAGTGGSITANPSGNYAPGAVVNITASANSGYKFDGWVSSNGGTFGSVGSASTTFTMPGNSTTVTANFTRTSGGGGGGGGGGGSGGGGGGGNPPAVVAVVDELKTHTPYVNGYPGNEFGATKNITRAEAAAILARILPDTYRAGATTSFTDVASDAWYYAEVTQLSSLGII